MALYILSRDKLLADFVLQEYPDCVGQVLSAESLPAQAVCIVDAETVSPPYPAGTCLVLSRTPREGAIPCLVRPLAPLSLKQALAPSIGEDSIRILAASGRGSAKGDCLVRGTASAALTAVETILCEALLPTLEGAPPLSREALCCLLAPSHSCNLNDMLTVYMYRLRKKLYSLRITLVTHREQGYSLRTED